MAVEAAAPKSSPDVQKLSGMAQRLLFVTKLTSKSGAEQGIISGLKGYSVDQIMSLQSSLPQTSGPGTYRFVVFEEGGPEKSEWTVKLGADIITPEASMTQPSFPPNGAGASTMNGDGSINIGHGFLYNPELGLLTTPQRQIFEWRPGVPLPGALPGTGVPGMPGFQGFGSAPSSTLPGASFALPATEDPAMRARMQMLEESLRDAREATKEADRRREAADTKAAFEKLVADSNSRFEALLAKLAEKPAGPSPMEEAMRRDLEETKRALVEGKREEAMRTEMREQALRFETALREIKETANRQPDPMIPLLTKVVEAQQSSAAQMATTMRDTAEINARAAKESADSIGNRLASSVMTPDKMMDLFKAAKDRTPESEVNKGLIEMFKTTFGMAQDVVRMQAEAMGQQAGPAWVPMVQQGLDQVGKVAALYMQKQAMGEAAAATETRRAAAAASAATARAAEERRQFEVRRLEAATARAEAAAAAQAALPPEDVVAPGGPTAAQVRDQAARAVFRGADRIAPAQAPAAPAPAPAPVAPAATSPGIDPLVRRGRGRPRRAAPAAVAPVAAAAPPEDVDTDIASTSPAPDLSKLPTDAIQSIVEEMDDETFFEAALSQIHILREQAQKGLPAAEAANAILMSRQYFQSYGDVPPAIEILGAGHIDILVDRLLPEATDEYRVAVADAIRVEMRKEAAGGSEAAS